MRSQTTVPWAMLLFAVLGFLVFSYSVPKPANAISIELKDGDPHRIERQKQASNGKLPLPDTPDVKNLKKRLAAKGLKRGNPVFIRVFKSESKLELWMKKNGRFIHFATYPVCNWSGTIGPKIAEGDKQTPEGFYTVTRRRLHLIGRWPRSLNLGFPNTYDQSHARTGSYILVHGGCSSVGCFAMTNAVMEEIYKLTSSAIRRGQRHVPIHAFPFRMTEENMSKHKASAWYDFWQDLKEGYDSFERTRLPPQVSVCRGRYTIRHAQDREGDTRPLAVCGTNVAAGEISELLERIVRQPSQWKSLSPESQQLLDNVLAPKLKKAILAGKVRTKVKRRLYARVRNNRRATPGPRFKCNPARASCRKHMALQRKIWARKSKRKFSAAKKHISRTKVRRNR